MGGNPFTSTGCNTCRRRKVKCDETRPECRRCTEHGHVCTGYERERVFIHKSSTSMGEGPQKLVRRAHATADKGTHQLVPVEPEIPRCNTSVELRSQLFQCFVDCFVPSSEYIRDSTGKNILQTLPDLAGDSRLLDKAVISLSSAFLAKQNQDRHLLEYSTKLYGNAIRMLNGKIRSGSTLGKDVLYTTVVFQIYELINCSPPGFSAWIAHVQGSNAITNQCAGSHGDSAAEKLFHRQLKFVTLCDAIGKRQAPRLYYPPAKHHDPSQGTEKIDPIDEIMDELVELTALMEEVDDFIEHEVEDTHEARHMGRRLLDLCFALEEKLHMICLGMQKRLGVPSLLPPDPEFWSGFRKSLQTDLFADHLQFPSMTCAECHLLYWTSLILLYPLIDQILASPGCPDEYRAPLRTGTSENATDASESPLDLTMTGSFPKFTALAVHYANEICRSVAYCLQPNMKTLGAQLLLAPLSQCAQFYCVHGLTHEYKWCQMVFMLVPQLGLSIGFFLKDMVWPKYYSAHRYKPSPPESPSSA
ncbi:hypothetical protein BDV59DRAFT_203275 [Aspergillus ambiguus]|uniref:Zn(II)2Cys6 transcription factor n=1 Tax=Aspergillus ambiguus TaxID=176160 RepID=UPI003CCE277F